MSKAALPQLWMVLEELILKARMDGHLSVSHSIIFHDFKLFNHHFLVNAASKGHLPVVLYLLTKQAANPLVRNKWGETAFDAAAAVFEVWICEVNIPNIVNCVFDSLTLLPDFATV